jgi:hypothetical protein
MNNSVRKKEGFKMKYQRYLIGLIFLLVIITAQACSKSSSSSDNGTLTPSGSLSVLVTDAPGDFEHVYITVKDMG